MAAVISVKSSPREIYVDLLLPPVMLLNTAQAIPLLVQMTNTSKMVWNAVMAFNAHQDSVPPVTLSATIEAMS